MTGSSLRAEELDRPLAYGVREKLREQLIAAGSDVPVFVLSDFRYMHEKHLQDHATISIGGPGVNALAHKWLQEVPIILEVEEEFYLQMGMCRRGVMQASVWGMDHASTEAAVGTFLEHYLQEFVPVVSQHARGA